MRLMAHSYIMITNTASAFRFLHNPVTPNFDSVKRPNGPYTQKKALALKAINYP